MSGLEVISFNPGVFSQLIELLFKVSNGIEFVIVIENLGLDLSAALFSFSYPQEPFLLILPFKQLHASVLISARR